jgi:hypothetical protein
VPGQCANPLWTTWLWVSRPCSHRLKPAAPNKSVRRTVFSLNNRTIFAEWMSQRQNASLTSMALFCALLAALWVAVSAQPRWDPGPELSPLEASSKTGLRDHPIGECQQRLAIISIMNKQQCAISKSQGLHQHDPFAWPQPLPRRAHGNHRKLALRLNFALGKTAPLSTRQAHALLINTGHTSTSISWDGSASPPLAMQRHRHFRVFLTTTRSTPVVHADTSGTNRSQP